MLTEHIHAIFDGDSLLFLGAGFSRNTKNISNELLPQTNQLSSELQHLSGIDSTQIDGTMNIQQTSEFFIEKNGANSLCQLLKNKFTVGRPEQWQRSLSNHPWQRIYTTNYDNVFEVASNLEGRRRYPVDITKKIERIENDNDKQVIHINGYVDFITPKNLDTSTKLTSSSYTDTFFLESQWRTEFEIDIAHARSIFFIGFSLDYDLDIKRIITLNKNNKNKIYFVNGKDMNPISKSALEKFGNVLDLDAQEFSELITDYRKSYIGKSDNKVRVFSFEEQEFLLNKEKIKDQDISDLFFGGHINKNKLYSNIDSSDYVIQREKALEIMDNIESFDLFLVQSYLGNGKSVFLDVLACLCVQKKYRVYKYNGNPDKIINDLTQLSRINETFIIIIIDDYYSLNKDFKYFSKLDKNKFKFIISGRKSIGQNVINELITKGGFNDEKTKSINLDFISVEEQVSIFNLIDDHNLWGKKSSFSKDKKEQFISITSKHGFKNIALELFKSNNILEKLYISYNKLDIVLKEIVIAHLINITLRYQLKIGQILTLTKRNSLSKATTDIPNFKEFIDIDNNIVNLDSSVAAMELLKKETNKVTIYNVMIEMLKTADKINSRDVYTNFMRGMVSFSNFKLLMSGVNDNQLNNYAVDYYEAIRNTRFAKENPFFWLQYGIQRLNEKEYDMADLFFANALSYATKKGLFDFYQINAQQARSIFERILNEDFPSDVAFDKFIKAHNLLLKDLTNHSNKKYYQLKQIFHYEPFFKQYYNKLTNDQQVAFIFHFNTIKNIFSEYYNDLESAKDKVTLSDMKHVSLSVNKLEKKIIKTNNK